MNTETEIEFGTLAIGTRFTIDTGVTFEKTSDRDAKIVAGSDPLNGIGYQFGSKKPVQIAANAETHETQPASDATRQMEPPLQSTKLVAVLGGGDWYDASVTHLVVQKDVNLETEQKARQFWYKNEYCPALQRGDKPKYLTFSEWLVERGVARYANEQEVEEFSED